MTEIYQDPQFADMFKPAEVKMVIKLSEEATKAIVDNYRGNKSGQVKMYIMLDLEGGLDRNWPYEHDWEKVVRRVTEAPLLAYNAQTKRTSRPVWYAKPADRTLANVTWEKVRLIPVGRVLDKGNLPANAVIIA